MRMLEQANSLEYIIRNIPDKITPFIIYVPEIAKSNIYQATKYKTLSAKGVTFNCIAKSDAAKNI
jgi:hypothetical protein